MRRVIVGLIAAFGGMFLLASVSGAASYPAPTGYVNDYADIISTPVENELNERLATFTASTSNELAVVTLTSLDGDTVENVAVDLFEQWGIGDKEKDNGVLLLIAVEDRELRIEVGYGLEPVLTDARAGNIIRNEITPRFKADDYDGGITAGVEAIIEVVSGDPSLYDTPVITSEPLRLMDLLPFTMMMLFVYAGAFLSRSKRYWPGGVIGLLGGWVLGLSLSVAVALLMALFLGGFGLMLDYFLSKNYKIRKAKGLSTNWWSSGGGFSSGSSSGSFGGFSGGSSGGGGSSGSW